jgi:hypothetical protein
MIFPPKIGQPGSHLGLSKPRVRPNLGFGRPQVVPPQHRLHLAGWQVGPDVDPW